MPFFINHQLLVCLRAFNFWLAAAKVWKRFGRLIRVILDHTRSASVTGHVHRAAYRYKQLLLLSVTGSRLPRSRLQLHDHDAQAVVPSL